METTQWIGVDVSLESLTIARRGAEGWEVKTITNTLSSIQEWIGAVEGAACQVVLEATGTYSAKVIHALHHAGIAFSVITPRQASQFSGVLKNITKNDERDACALCLFGQHMQPPVFAMPGEEVERLRQLRTLLHQLRKQQQALRNQRHALEQLPQALPLALDIIDQTLAHLQEQIQRLEAEICTLSTETFAALTAKITTIKGIGRKTALALLVATDGLRHFTNVKQLAKFVGLAPTQRFSGKSVNGPTHINRAADPKLRTCFYLATWSACKSNKACIELRQRMKNKGKPPKVILIAVAHKLLRQIWGVDKNDSVFDNNYHLTEANA